VGIGNGWTYRFRALRTLGVHELTVSSPRLRCVTKGNAHRLVLSLPGSVLATAESTGAGVTAFFVFVLGVPLPFLLFYREKDVELTCKHRDPVDRSGS